MTQISILELKIVGQVARHANLERSRHVVLVRSGRPPKTLTGLDSPMVLPQNGQSKK